MMKLEKSSKTNLQEMHKVKNTGSDMQEDLFVFTVQTNKMIND